MNDVELKVRTQKEREIDGKFEKLPKTLINDQENSKNSQKIRRMA
jgi:hypothetical protein